MRRPPSLRLAPCVVTALLACLARARPCAAQDFRFVRRVPTGIATEAAFYDSERGQMAVFSPTGEGRLLRTDGTAIRSVRAPSSGFLDAAAYDTIQHHAMFLTQDCTLTEADPVTFAMVSRTRLGHGLSVCAGLAVGRDNNLYIASYGTNEMVVLNRTGAALVRRVALTPLRFPGVDGLAYIPGSDNILLASSSGAGAMVITPLGAVVTPPAAVGARPLMGGTVPVPDGLTSVCANGHVWLCEAYGTGCADFQQTTGDRRYCGCHESGGVNGCSGGTPVCDDTTNTCRGCRAASDCASGTPVCDVASGRCAICSAGDARACAGSDEGRACVVGAAGAPTCGCATDADCGGATSGRVCDVGARRCVDGCSPAAGRNGCPAGLVCDATGEAVGRCAPAPDASMSDVSADGTPDASADVASDLAADVASDVVSDVASDLAAEVGPDVAEDVAADAVADVSPDVAEDVAADAVPDVSPDAAEDVAADAAPDLAADAGPDVPADTAEEVAQDSGPNVPADVSADAAEDLGRPDGSGPNDVVTTDGAGPDPANQDGGCGCSTPAPRTPGAIRLALLAAALAALGRRRARSSSAPSPKRNPSAAGREGSVTH